MSLSLPMKDPNGRQYSSDSFDRFGDNLSELLLSYLPFKDTFRLECVSKQWKRLVFNKVLLFQPFWPNNKIIANNDMKTLLKKCHNIERMSLFFNEHNVSALSQLSDICPRLKSINLIVGEDVTSEAIIQFGQEFGAKVDVLYLLLKDDSTNEQILGWCPNVKLLLNFGRINWLPLVGNQLVPTLNQISQVFVRSEQMSDFVQLVDKYENTMKVMSVSFGNPEYIDLMFEQLYRLQNLQCLCVKLKANNLDLTTRLTTLSQGCPELRKVKFDIHGLFVISPPTKLLIGIKSLSISWTSSSCNTKLRDDFFANLADLTPNLKEFNYHSDHHILNKHLIDLSQIKGLKSLVFWSQTSTHSTDDSAVIQLLDNCKELKKLKLNFYSNITEKTIDKLKEVTNNRPKENICFGTKFPNQELKEFRDLIYEIHNLTIVD